MTIQVNAETRKALKAMIVEMTHCLARIDAEKEHIKDIAEAAEENFEIKKKFINKMARTMHNESYKDLQTENEAFEFLYEAVIDFETTAEKLEASN